ncbi:hypothetical protein BGZ96_002431 [Linnemannia gamsii]|uniref:Uncharacterized protein n=1 Tax=Linnemannia gamsii TaxID=64522 RepID=A0ABQ7K9K6_9FUNG|nr:hypothetical protein BGZ96_002431 [Linnemannia gamsii]
MSLKSYVLGSSIFQTLFSLSIWFLLLGIPAVIIVTMFFYTAKGTGNVAGFIVDKTAKRVRSYQQQQRKRDKVEPAVGSQQQQQYRTSVYV